MWFYYRAVLQPGNAKLLITGHIQLLADQSDSPEGPPPKQLSKTKANCRRQPNAPMTSDNVPG